MPLSPEPNLRRGVVAGLRANLIDLVLGKKLAAAIHDLAENLTALAARNIFARDLLGNFMWRLGREIELLMSAIHQQIAITHARVKLEPRQIEIAPLEAAATDSLSPSIGFFAASRHCHRRRDEGSLRGRITDAEAQKLIRDLERDLDLPGFEFYTGVSYRNLLVLSRT